jgi:outer membrane protein assembly factor BamB
VLPDTAGAEPVLIELGADHGRPDDAAPDGRTDPWLARIAVLVAMLLCVAASAAPPPPPLRELLAVPVQPADTYALTDDGLLLVHTAAAGMLAAYSMVDGRALWRAAATAPAYRMRSAGGLVLLRPQIFGEVDPGTVALAAGTGTARWRHPGSVVSVAGAPTVVAVSQVRSLAGSGRRVQGPVVGVDPVTGRTRWSVDVPSTAVLQDLPGDPSKALLVYDNGTAELRELATGGLLAAARLPAADYGPGNPGISGGTVLLRHPSGPGYQITAYDPVTLRPRWNRPAWSAYEVRSCGRFACFVDRTGVRAVDPATGEDRWSGPGWYTVEQRGDLVLAYGAPAGAGGLIGLVDPDTGRITVDLLSWRAVPGPSTDHLLVTRDVALGARTVVAVATPGAARPRLLGHLPHGTGDCRTAQRRLVCRSTSGTLVLWSYR